MIIYSGTIILVIKFKLEKKQFLVRSEDNPFLVIISRQSEWFSL